MIFFSLNEMNESIEIKHLILNIEVIDYVEGRRNEPRGLVALMSCRATLRPKKAVRLSSVEPTTLRPVPMSPPTFPLVRSATLLKSNTFFLINTTVPFILCPPPLFRIPDTPGTENIFAKTYQ